MEPIIILIDAESRCVRLYGKYNRIIPFFMAFVLPSLLNGEQVLYISGLEQVQGEEVINLLTYMVTEEDQPTEKLFIRSKQDGYIRIPELKLTFSGSKDAKEIEKIGWDLFDRSATLRNLLMADKVEVLYESAAKALRKHKLDPKGKDKSLDTILLNKSVKEMMESQDMFGFGEGDGEEVTEDSGEKILTENEQIMKQFGSNWGKDKKKDA